MPKSADGGATTNSNFGAIKRVAADRVAAGGEKMDGLEAIGRMFAGKPKGTGTPSVPEEPVHATATPPDMTKSKYFGQNLDPSRFTGLEPTNLGAGAPLQKQKNPVDWKKMLAGGMQGYLGAQDDEDPMAQLQYHQSMQNSYLNPRTY